MPRNIGAILGTRLRQAEGQFVKDEEEEKLLRLREKLGIKDAPPKIAPGDSAQQHVDVLPEILQNTPVLGVKQRPPVERDTYSVKSGFEGKPVPEGSFVRQLSDAFRTAYRQKWSFQDLRAPDSPPPPRENIAAERAQRQQQQANMGFYTRKMSRQQGDARLRAIAAVTGAFVIATGLVLTGGTLAVLLTFKKLEVNNLSEFGEKMRGEVGPRVREAVLAAKDTHPVLQLPGALGRSVADGVKRLVGSEVRPAPAPATSTPPSEAPPRLPLPSRPPRPPRPLREGAPHRGVSPRRSDSGNVSSL
eukprot:tig00021493_g21866.t1